MILKAGKLISRISKFAIIPAIIIGIMVLSSCGKDEPGAEAEKTRYADWVDYSYGNFNIHFSPTSKWLSNSSDLAQGYNRFLKEICAILEMPIPTEKIELYVYSPGVDALDVSGRKVPFFNETEIHWAGLYPYGYQLTKFLIAKKGFKPGKFHVLNEGVPHLLDFSGVNYHDKANRLVNSGQFIPVSDLGNNQKFDSLPFPVRRSESASLSGYIMFHYGVNRLFMIWSSTEEWTTSIETIFQMPVAEFEDKWKGFALREAIDPEGTTQNDTVQDMKVEWR